MGRSPCCTNNNLNKGAWTKEEDEILGNYVKIHGAAKWNILCKKAGLNRCGKSCRLRWTNYLRPDIKRGNFSEEEDSLIINLHSSLGNKWSKIASQLPGRTDNEIKNHWNTKLRKKLNKLGIEPQTHKQIPNFNLFNSLQMPPLFSQQDVTQLAKLQLLHFQTLLQTINAITTTFPSNPLMPNINYPMQDDVNGILNFSMPNFEVPGHYNFNSIPDSETCFQSGLISSEVLNVNSIHPETSTLHQGSLNYLNSSTMSSSTLMFETWKELVNDETDCPFFSNCNLE